MSIEVKEVIEDKDSWFNIKRLKVGGLTIDRPLKTIDVRPTNSSKHILNNHLNSSYCHNEFAIFELSKNINYEIIQNILNSRDQGYINKIFRPINYRTDKYLYIITPTFKFNPYQHSRSIDDFDGFFDYYCQYSDVLFVPNLSNYRYIKEGGRWKKEEIVTLQDYLRFVDDIYNILTLKNKKSIFVPISLKFSMNEVDKIIEHYIEKEYFYYWFDFEGKAVNDYTIAFIAHINRRLKENEVYDGVVSYFTNVRREIVSSPKEKEAPASDILTVFIGANVIGCNKESPRIIEQENQTKVSQQEMLEHKARRFVEKTYYYIKVSEDNELSLDIKERLKHKKYNTLYNTLLLNKELDNLTKYFLSRRELKNILKNKRMLTEYKDGKLLDSLFTAKQELSNAKLTDFLY